MRLKKPLLFLLAVLLAASAAVPLRARADAEHKTVRVGWYESSAFNRTDSFGRKSGYGYEYQQRIAVLTGWRYEYVEGSWSELLEMLLAGEIDLLSDVSYTEERAEKILYSAEAMGSESYYVFIAPDNTEIRPDDYATLNGKRVGVNKSSVQSRLFAAWAQDHGVTPEIVELSVTTAEEVLMLADGKLDAIVTLDSYANTGNIVPVCKVGASSYYFGVSKSRPDLKQELDAAMNRILEDDRGYNERLSERYRSIGSLNSFLSPDETDWLASRGGVIRIGYRDDFLPFSDTDDASGALTGMLRDFLAFAEKSEMNAQLAFETRAYKTSEETLQALSAGEIDCVFPLSVSAFDGEQRGVALTDPFVETQMYAVVRTSARRGMSADQPMTAAVVSGYPSYESFIKDNFPSWKIVYFENGEDGFRAVAAGEADCCLVSNYLLARVSGTLGKNSLSPLATGRDMSLCFAVRRDDAALYTILNKVVRLVPEAFLNASLTNYAFPDEKTSIVDFMRDNLLYFVGAAVIVAMVILLLVQRNRRVQALAGERSRIIAEAEKDKLTGLYNRSFFPVYMNRLYAEHPDRPMDAIALDIDRFHSLNALNGHTFGDEVLSTLGREIGDFAAQNHGIAARSEGDHFDIYCAHQDDYAGILRRFRAQLNTLSRSADIQLRMGVMPWQPDLKPEQLIDRAWVACRSIRGDYKTHLLVYNDSLGKREETNQILRNDLARALEQREFEVYYQPKMDIRTDPPQLRSAEALVRWNHPTLGVIGPEDFIPLFERSGQIVALDNFVWTESARQISAWRAQYGKTVPVSVNLSRVDVFDPSLASTLDKLIDRYSLSRGDLTLEITESAYTENADHLIRVISDLREKGYVIEMDDFGSGYSSLNMLSSLPVDVIKMDIAFIRNVGRNERDFRLVELILDIAKYLKVLVVAEGVETEKQLRLLKDAGCDLVQGYYFSKPLPADDFARAMF